jgi:putative addiction module component (TIGR02574 family)
VIAKTKCNLSIVLLERLPEVQSLSVEDKWRLIDELWSDLAQEVERGGVDENTLALLNQRFEEYVQDPGQAQPHEACLARLAERKRQWK